MKWIGDSIYRVMIMLMLWTIYLTLSGEQFLSPSILFVIFAIGTVAGAVSGRD